MLTLAISSRTLFDLDDAHQIYLEQGIEAYRSYQLRNEDEPLEPGVAFPLVQKLLNIKHPDTNEPQVEVVLVSRNNGDTGLRIFNSIEHHGLDISRAVFSNGGSPYDYLSALGVELFLSAHHADVIGAINAGYAAAHLMTRKAAIQNDEQVRVAFDGDAVLFSDESEQIYQTGGLEAFRQNEHKRRNEPLNPGPFSAFLKKLHDLQSLFASGESPIRTALVTARSAPSHKRVILTLRQWGIRIDEALFLGGQDKAKFLQSFKADIFFEDQLTYVKTASEHTATGHVPYGVTNQNK
ncbi:5'-nucleotidase [Marinicella sp. S1101]|uniref:5'-nucleotidase n=1 Tax=Marinicella marina TaxID=2996016 RepID=UPI002260CB35|nr:5'-nucleotidase [Marinicella marina]MCX7554773.1 5'-nucleotidase [Marinicella marina]MDJ1140994.1 5'-nucleotidase [Marinicella marina]